MTRVTRPWTPEEDAVMRARYPAEGTIPLARALNRSRNSIKCHARFLGLRNAPVGPLHIWTPEEDQLIREKWPLVRRRKLKAITVIDRLGLPEHWVRERAMQLGVATTQRRGPPWSAAEDEYLYDHAYLGSAALRRHFLHHGWVRSKLAISQRLYLLHQSTQRHAQRYSASYLAELMGLSQKTIVRWIKWGWLEAKARSDASNTNGGPAEYAITPRAVRKLLLTHTHQITIDRADKHWLVNLLAGEGGSLPVLRQSTCGTAHEAAGGYDEYEVRA